MPSSVNLSMSHFVYNEVRWIGGFTVQCADSMDGAGMTVLEDGGMAEKKLAEWLAVMQYT